MSFIESNTVEQMILDAATSHGSGAGNSVLSEKASSHLNITFTALKLNLLRTPKPLGPRRSLTQAAANARAISSRNVARNQ
jgi:hypothetical protein